MARTTALTRGVVDCYVRNSTALQVDNWRADYQRTELPKVCERYGYGWALCEEQGTSGESLTNRKVMQAILERIRTGERAGIACVSFDRLSRDIDLIDGLTIWSICKEAGAVILTPDKLWKPGDDNDDDTAFIQFWLAGRNKRAQLDNLYEGIVQRASTEGFVRGRAPYGYRRRLIEETDKRGRLRVRRQLEADPEVQDVVRYVFEHYPQQSVTSLMNDLNAKGNQDPHWLRRRWRNDGTYELVNWYKNDLIRMVHLPLYAGIVRWGMNPKSKRVRELLAEREGRPFVHVKPEWALVDQSTWAACQVQKDGEPGRARRGEGRSPRYVSSDAIFSGVLHCPTCGSLMYHVPARVVSKNTNYTVPSYVCGAYLRGGKNVCKPHQVREHDLLDLMRPEVERTLAKLRLVDYAKLRLEREQTTADVLATQQERDALQSAKAGLFDDRYKKRLITDEDFHAATTRYNKELEAIERRLLQAAEPATAPDAQLLDLLQSLSKTPKALIAQLLNQHPREVTDPVANREYRRWWRDLVRALYERIDISHEPQGSTRKALVEIADYTYTDAVRQALREEGDDYTAPQPPSGWTLQNYVAPLTTLLDRQPATTTTKASGAVAGRGLVRVADGHYALMVAGRSVADIVCDGARRSKDARSWWVRWPGGERLFPAFADARTWTLTKLKGAPDRT